MIKDPFQRLNLDREILSVSQLNGRARVLLEDVFAQVWVEGEISNLAKPASGHLYFTLKDSQAQVRCALFRQNAARVRQAQARQTQALENVVAAERGVIAQTRSAYAAWQASQAVAQSSAIAVDANRLSLEGVRAENSVGTRTILDILNAEQEYLNAQVQLVTARRDAYVAGFTLLAAMGRGEARDLNLADGAAGVTLYNPDDNYNRVRHRIWDWDEDATPVAHSPSTRTSTAQDANVPANAAEDVAGPPR